MKKKDIIFFAETTFRRQRNKVGIKTDDRYRHIYVIGKTGMGKTVMLENMMIQDIRAGRGVGIIDPHGEAAEDILDFIPKNRINDVVYFNPADLNYPIAFNVMEKVEPEYRHLVASGLMEVFKKIWPDVWSARMEYILGNSILALLEYPNSTLLGVNRMLADPDFRGKIVSKIRDPVVKSFWVNEFARYTQRYEVEATAAIQNKIGQLISNPLIRNIIGQVKSKIDMRKLMDKGKILIANLSKGKIGEDNSKLLGALLVTKLQLAAMSRVDVPEEKRKEFFLYVDEFQNFATGAFVSILSEARKYKLSLTLANQYMAQLEEVTPAGKSSRVRDAVFGNIGTLIVFRVGAEDAEYLEKEFVPEVTTEDLVNLSKYNIYLKLMIEGIAGRPFSAETLPSFEKPKKSYRKTIINISRERYGIERKIIESKISRWTGLMDEALIDAKTRTQRFKKLVLYDAQCSVCGKRTKVVFPPDGVRPVYCKSCLRKIEKPSVYRGTEEKTKTISLENTKKLEPVSFSSSKKPDRKQRRPKKKVDIKELKKALEKALKKEK
ncbi:MAG: type IV secretion system DNA-binding domain-containing protein [Candidatus Nealsonbacteria bacterium]